MSALGMFDDEDDDHSLVFEDIAQALFEEFCIRVDDDFPTVSTSQLETIGWTIAEAEDAGFTISDR